MGSRSAEHFPLEDDPLWYKDAIIYELHVRSFYDSDGDGVGDLRGITEKLDYLQDLGVTALWLLPFYPSPLRDDGYDIADYTSVHPLYGNLRDVRNFLREAHRRGLRVITELVLNHSSDQHPWFQRARRAAPGTPWRDFYVWSDTAQKYQEARIIFKDFESSNWAWDPVAQAYYWHRFYSHQPDLNYDEPQVQRAMLQVVDFWLALGVDGLRLDAVPYLFEREGTSCENLPETHAFLKVLRRHVDGRFKNRMLLAEANQWPEDAVAYFAQGDECHMAFHFPLMPRLFMAIHTEDRFPLMDILQSTPPIPDICQWALFLRNHDELTLEMVTDEERDYMYRVYAQDPQMRMNLGVRRRLAPLLGNSRRRIELMNGLLFSLPGTPVVYYGDEIGMGDNIYLGDRNGVRTPMQWSADRNAGFSRANAQRLYLPIIIDPEYHYEAVNVEAQQGNRHSFLWWMKRLIALRKRFKAFGRGTLEFLQPDNHKVLAFLRRYQDECILVVANLSRFVQGAQLDLAPFRGMVPVEIFGQTRFPPVGETPYFLSLGPHAFYWFALEPERPPVAAAAAPEVATPVLSVAASWEAVLRGRAKARLESVLLGYLGKTRWFGGKARTARSAEIRDAVPVPYAATLAYLLLFQVEYTEGEPETYLLPLTFGTGDKARQDTEKWPQGVVAVLKVGDEEGVEEGLLYDALRDREFCRALLQAVARRQRFKGAMGQLFAVPTPALRALWRPSAALPEPSLLQAEQSNTSVVYGDRLILKLFRRLEGGPNPEYEMGHFLTVRRPFPHAPPLAGVLEYRRTRQDPMTLAVLHGFSANVGDAWRYTLDALGRYYEQVLALPAVPESLPLPQKPLVALTEAEIPPQAYEVIGSYIQAAELLGRRTAELHLTLGSEPNDPNFAPEPFTPHYQRSLYQSMQALTTRTCRLLRQQLGGLPDPVRPLAQQVLEQEGAIMQRFRSILGRKITAKRIRCHGDYHLGQVLNTGKDFVIIDFEGEPRRPLGERRIKRCPLWDVAGMLRSFHYASRAALAGQAPGGAFRAEDSASLETWARFWQVWVSVAFLKAYRATMGPAQLLPREPEEFQMLLDVFLLEKAVYEAGYEMAHRPHWVSIPLAGVLGLLEAADGAAA